MNPENEALLLDLVEWIGKAPQPYDAVMDAWRTSCPRLSVWEDAVDRGFVLRENVEGTPTIRITPAGLRFLEGAGRISPVSPPAASPSIPASF